MSGTVICAAAGCDHPVTRRPGRRGRPPIYCSPACRPGGRGARITVEVTQREVDDDVSPVWHAWTVSLRRGGRQVVIATAMGRFSADALAKELRDLIGPIRQGGGVIE